jgi:hypothetical protein
MQASTEDFFPMDLEQEQYKPIWSTHSGIVGPKSFNAEQQIGFYGLDRNLVVGNEFMKELQKVATPIQSPNQSPNQSPA